MPAPKRPNTAAATAAVRRRGDETAAARLRSHGWIVISPEATEALPDHVRRRIYDLTDTGRPHVPATKENRHA